MQKQQDGPNWDQPFSEMRQHMQLLLAFALIISMPLSAWTRKLGTWGTRYAGLHMGLGWMAMPLFSLAHPQDDGRWIMLAWALTGLLLLLHRIRGALRRRYGYWVPSQYGGESAIPLKNEWRAKASAEPAVVMFFGGVAFGVSPIVGTWMVVAALCQGLAVSVAWEAELARIRAARDARFQARYEMELLRRELGEDT